MAKVFVRKIKEKYRIVYGDSRKFQLARANEGTGRPADGGGHTDKAKAERQLEHIKNAV